MPRTGDIRCVPVPGCVDGWLALHSRDGRLPSRQGAARLLHGFTPTGRGFPVSQLAHRGRPPGRCKRFLAARTSLPRPHPGRGAHRPASRCSAGNCGQVAVGGRAGFYGGEFGEGLLRLGAGEYVGANLATSFADWVEPLSVEAFGSRIWTTPPNSQGYLTLAAAWIADGLGLPDDTDDPLWAHLSVEAACQAAYDRTDVLHEHADGARSSRRSALPHDARPSRPTRRRCCPAVTPRATRSTCRRGSRPDGCLVDPVERRQLRL